MRRSCVVFTVLVLGASGAPAAAQQPGPAVSAVQRAVDAWKPVRTVHATFEQYVANALTGTNAHAMGEYQQQRPGKLAVRFQNPSGDQIVSDGAFVWLYLPSSTPGQVVKRAMGQYGTGTVDLTSEFLDAPLSRYDVGDGGPEMLDGRSTRIVKLTPRAGVSSPFTSARVWIDDRDALIRQFEVHESSGVTRRVHITSLTVNQAVDGAAFRFVVPSGVRVVTP